MARKGDPARLRRSITTSGDPSGASSRLGSDSRSNRAGASGTANEWGTDVCTGHTVEEVGPRRSGGAPARGWVPRRGARRHRPGGGGHGGPDDGQRRRAADRPGQRGRLGPDGGRQHRLRRRQVHQRPAGRRGRRDAGDHPEQLPGLRHPHRRADHLLRPGPQRPGARGHRVPRRQPRLRRRGLQHRQRPDPLPGGGLQHRHRAADHGLPPEHERPRQHHRRDQRHRVPGWHFLRGRLHRPHPAGCGLGGQRCAAALGPGCRPGLHLGHDRRQRRRPGHGAHRGRHPGGRRRQLRQPERRRSLRCRRARRGHRCHPHLRGQQADHQPGCQLGDLQPVHRRHHRLRHRLRLLRARQPRGLLRRHRRRRRGEVDRGLPRRHLLELPGQRRALPVHPRPRLQQHRRLPGGDPPDQQVRHRGEPGRRRHRRHRDADQRQLHRPARARAAQLVPDPGPGHLPGRTRPGGASRATATTSSTAASSRR